MKLSEKQKEVISALRSGKKLYKCVTYCYIENGKISISLATFFKLLNEGIIIIGNKNKHNLGWQCQLTPLGKTIEL